MHTTRAKIHTYDSKTSACHHFISGTPASAHSYVGSLTIEEYIQRRRETIVKYAQTRDIYGKSKSSRKIAIATYFGGSLIIIAMTLQRL
jgi:hypothetical protein